MIVAGITLTICIIFLLVETFKSTKLGLQKMIQKRKRKKKRKEEEDSDSDES